MDLSIHAALVRACGDRQLRYNGINKDDCCLTERQRTDGCCRLSVTQSSAYSFNHRTIKPRGCIQLTGSL